MPQKLPKLENSQALLHPKRAAQLYIPKGTRPIKVLKEDHSKILLNK